MKNLTNQQQAIILKGIAQQILQMNVPTFETVGKLFKDFGIDFEGNDTYTKMYAAIKVACSLDDATKNELGFKDLHHTITHYTFKCEEANEFEIKKLLFKDSDSTTVKK